MPSGQTRTVTKTVFARIHVKQNTDYVCRKMFLTFYPTVYKDEKYEFRNMRGPGIRSSHNTYLNVLRVCIRPERYVHECRGILKTGLPDRVVSYFGPLHALGDICSMLMG